MGSPRVADTSIVRLKRAFGPPLLLTVWPVKSGKLKFRLS